MKLSSHFVRAGFLSLLLSAAPLMLAAQETSDIPPPPDQSATPMNAAPMNNDQPAPDLNSSEAKPSPEIRSSEDRAYNNDHSYNNNDLQSNAQQNNAQQNNDQPMQSVPPPPPSASADVSASLSGPNLDSNQSSDQNAEKDPPSRVARLQYMSGQVSIQPNGTSDWVLGVLNRPLTTSDNIWADKGSRAELSLGSGVFRLGGETSLTVTALTDNQVQLQLHQGTLDVRVRHLYNGESYEVDTPNQAFTILKTGEYRLDVNPAGDATLVTVWKGEGEATGQGPGVHVSEGQQATFTGASTVDHTIAEAPAPDGFDDWCKVRDNREDHSISARYVSPDVIGSEDLDDHGSWRDVPTYGHIWVPSNVDSSWAPYHDGHWGYVEPWGYTWIDDEPWGFAPFHYGRWVYNDNYWGWSPGPYYGAYYNRAYYAPALVGWFGGPRWGLGFGGYGYGGLGFGFGGGFGWCALGWGEPFYPWYGGGRNYFRNVNIRNTRITNINNYYGNRGLRASQGVHYANLHHPGGATAMSKEGFARGASVAKNGVHVPSTALRNATALRRGVNVAPTRESRLGGNAARATSVAPSRSFSRPVVARNGSTYGGVRNASSHATSPVTATRGNGNASGNTNFNRGAVANNQAGNRPTGVINNSPANRGGFNSANATHSGSTNLSPRDGGRYVPRPPSAGGSSQTATNRGVEANRSPNNNGGFGSRNIPRPSVSATPSTPHYGANNESGFNRGGANTARNIPRPSGNVQPDTRTYSNPGRGSYNSSPRNYGGGSNTASPRSYGGGSYNSSPRNYGGGGSYSAPRNYGGGGSYSPPRNYGGGGGGGYSAPRSYGGGGGSSGGGYHGGGGSSGGGGNRGGGGGGGAAPHSNGGGGGGGGNHAGGHR